MRAKRGIIHKQMGQSSTKNVNIFSSFVFENEVKSFAIQRQWEIVVGKL